MTDLSGHYRVLLDEGADLEAKLVHADALEGLGDPRGRLFMLQLASAREPDRADLQVEEIRWIDQHADVLLGPLATARYDDGLELVWRQGFVRGASLRRVEREVPVLLERLLRIPMFESIGRLRLAEDSNLAACSRLLAARPPPLVDLVFGLDARNKPVEEAADLSALWPAFPNLESFAGCGARLGELDLPRLRTFDLSTDAWAFDMSELGRARWPSLARLRLAGFSTVDVRRVVEALQPATMLRELSLDELGEDGDLAFECLLQSTILSRLARLELCGAVTTRGARELIWNAERFSALERLAVELVDTDPETRRTLEQALPQLVVYRGQ
ncbi:MAG: hypothetical protein U0271_47440 [Polyangiaceae bacterium]